jgi:hypothetical protein
MLILVLAAGRPGGGASTVETDVTAIVFTGGLDSGKGRNGAGAIVADELGLNVGQVRVTFDSQAIHVTPVYSNKFHGRDTVAATGAARKVRENFAAAPRPVTSHLELNDGRIFIRAPQKGSPLLGGGRAYWSLADEQPELVLKRSITIVIRWPSVRTTKEGSRQLGLPAPPRGGGGSRSNLRNKICAIGDSRLWSSDNRYRRRPVHGATAHA